MASVLVIEDDQRIRETIARSLAADGHSVRTEARGADALGTVVDWRPDVVVLDLGLPDLEGREVLTGIRNHAPAARVVVFSGTRPPANEWVAERVEGFVSKEQNIELLVETLEAAARQPFELNTYTLPHSPLSVHRAREAVRAALTQWGQPELVSDGLVVVSELVTNAVVHAASRCELRLSNHRRSVRVAVVDSGPGTPEPLPPSTARVGGRGLQIVDSMSIAWGVDGLADGRKLVWAELARP
jgi:DNA-binding response OmpR family regulator